jgi:hypothetical protein
MREHYMMINLENIEQSLSYTIFYMDKKLF